MNNPTPKTPTPLSAEELQVIVARLQLNSPASLLRDVHALETTIAARDAELARVREERDAAQLLLRQYEARLRDWTTIATAADAANAELRCRVSEAIGTIEANRAEFQLLASETTPFGKISKASVLSCFDACLLPIRASVITASTPPAILAVLEQAAQALEPLRELHAQADLQMRDGVIAGEVSLRDVKQAAAALAALSPYRTQP